MNEEVLETRPNFYVLTGGPGSGKTTLLSALAKAGVAAVPEAGRRIIQTQQAIGGQSLPWISPLAYAEADLTTCLLRYMEAASQRLTVFDRGLLDPAGFLKFEGFDLPEHFQRAIERFRYNPTVFIAPPWREIYEQDQERKQNFAEAVETCEVMAELYQEAGYDLLVLPEASVTERLSFVLTSIAAPPSGQE